VRASPENNFLKGGWAMASRKEYEMLFQLNAQLGSSFNSTFKSGQSSIASMQKEIEALSKTQSDISAFQKQQSAVEATKKKLEVLGQQYDNIQKEIQETEGFSASLENQLLSKQQQIDKTSASLEQQTQKLDRMGAALNEAGIDTGNLTQESAQLGEKLEEVKQKQEEAADKANNFGSVASSAFAAVGKAIVAAGVVKALQEIYDWYSECIGASIEFESVMAGVRRTVGGTDEELAAMAAEFKAMSLEIPITTTELGKIAETAGQLGIAQEYVTEFTEVMAMLATTTDLTAENAATMLAQFANITGTTDYQRLGSAVAELGDATATTASKVVDMSQGMAAAANIAGFSETDILAVSAAVGSLGIEAQAGSTAMSTLIQTLYKAVETGSDKLTDFAAVAGMTADEFTAAWGDSAVSAMDAFIQGLNDTERNGRSAVVILDELGITNIRQTKAILGLASAGDLLSNTIIQANQAWEENTALQGKADIMYGTTESKLTLLQNAYSNLKAAVGDVFLPTLRDAAGVGTDVLVGVTEFIEANPALIKAVTVFGGVLIVATTALAVYATATKIAATETWKLIAATVVAYAPILAVIAAVAALAGVFTFAISKVSDADKEFKKLTATSKEQYLELREMEAEYQDVCDAYGETSEEAKILRGEVTLLREEYESSKITLEDFEAQLKATADAYSESMNAHREATESIAAEESVSLALVNRLNKLASQSQLTASEQAELQAIIDSLNESVPGLGLSFDSLSGSISLTADKIIALAEAEAAARQYAVDNKTLIGLVNQRETAYSKLLSVQEEVAATQKRVNDAQAAYDAKSAKYANSSNNDRAALLWKETEALRDAQFELDNYVSKEKDAQDTYDGIISSIATLSQRIADYTDSLSAAADGSEEHANSLQRLIELAPEYASAIYEAYNDAYAAAYSSLTGQISLTQAWESGTKTSVDAIISNINSYTTAFAEYNTNLKAALENGLDPAVAERFFSEVSAESSAALAAIAEGGEGAAARINEAYSGALAETDALSGTLGTVASGYLNELNAMMEGANAVGEAGATELVKIIASTIIENGGILTDADIEVITAGLQTAEADTKDDAQAVGEALPEGMATGVYSRASVLYTAITSVMNTALAKAQATATASGLFGASSGVGTRGYASGTLSAVPGLALVGENGPELINFGGGEVVYTADETRKILEAYNAANTEEAQIIALAPQLMSYVAALGGGHDAISADIGGSG